MATLAVFAASLSLVSAAPAPWGWSGGWGWHGHGKGPGNGINVQLGPRPYYLVDNMDDGPLKEKLESCAEGPFKTSSFSISHRGAPLMFPEHSREGYVAAARMGAGIIECDLQYTTDILARPELAAKCSQPFTPANDTAPASAKCCTSDITLAEFKSLCAEMEATTFNAKSINASAPYFGRIGTTPDWRTNMYAYSCAETMSLRDQIQLVDSLGLNFTAEAKTPEIQMPFEGDYTQEDFAQQIVDTFRQGNIAADRVWLQSFLPADIFYWLQTDPAFGAQAIYLDERADTDVNGYQEAVDSLRGLADRGVNIISPSTWQLVTLDNSTTPATIVPSTYATAAKAAGLEIITWSFDRSGPLENGGGYYYQGVNPIINNDGDEYNVIDVVAQQVGATKIFADWAATVTYYANCFGL